MDNDEFFEGLLALRNQAVFVQQTNFQQLMQRLFALFDQAPEEVAGRVRWLRAQYPYERVESDVLKPQSGIGPGRLNWPLERELRLGAQLNLFAHLAEGEQDGWRFAYSYFDTSSRNINITLQSMTSQLLDPMIDELARYLERNLGRPLPAGADRLVPAADRIVRTDHNSAAFAEVKAGLDSIGTALREFNDITVDDRDRVLSELEASKTILNSQTIRLTAIGFVGGLLYWILDQFGSAAFAPTVQSTLMALKGLFPDLPI